MRQERWQCLYCEARNNLSAELCSTCGRSSYDVSDSDAQTPRRASSSRPARPRTESAPQSAADEVFEAKIKAWAEREEAEEKAALDPRRKDGSNIIHWKVLLSCLIAVPACSYFTLYTLTSERVVGGICNKFHQCTHWEIHGFTPMVLLALSWLAVVIAAGSTLVDHLDRRVHNEAIYYRVRMISLILYFVLQAASMVVGYWLDQITFLPE